MKKLLNPLRRYDVIFPVIFLLILLSPFLYFFANIFLGLWAFKKIETGFEQGNLKLVKTNSFLGADSFRRANNFFQIGQPIFRLVGLTEKGDKIARLFQLGQISFEGITAVLVAGEEANQVFLAATNGEEKNFAENWHQIEIELGKALEKTALSQSLLNNFSGREIFFGSFLARAKKELPQTRIFLQQGQQITQIMPRILGLRERKTYLLLFQNNMELRPTGGFIGSFGLLTLDNGRLLDFEIQDVYFADGQLRGHVEPPAKLREFLGQAGWYLRDSNWDPDFPTSAARAEWFLEKETNRTVDGVIALDLFVIQKLLEVLGPVELFDYQETVTAQNFFERAQFRSEVGFFPGSTGKKDFLGAVSNALFEKMKKADQKEVFGAGLAFYRSLLEKDILIYLHDEVVAKQISLFNWDGSLKNVNCLSADKAGKMQNEKCFEDYLMINEANVGINKANYFLSRDLDLEIKINDDGSVEKNLTIYYQNKSPNNIFPAGVYKNYLRLYLPEGSSFGGCKIGPPAGEAGNLECKIEEMMEHQRQVFGFLIEVPVKEVREIKFSWRLPGTLTKGQYRLLWQKQPGTRNDHLLIHFVYPPNWWLIPRTSGFLTGGEGLIYNGDLSEDKIFDIEIRKLE